MLGNTIWQIGKRYWNDGKSGGKNTLQKSARTRGVIKRNGDRQTSKNNRSTHESITENGNRNILSSGKKELTSYSSMRGQYTETSRFG